MQETANICAPFSYDKINDKAMPAETVLFSSCSEIINAHVRADKTKCRRLDA